MPNEETAGPTILRNGFYLHVEGDYVGPFHSHDDAGRFLILMAVFGGDCAGVEIVEIREDA